MYTIIFYSLKKPAENIIYKKLKSCVKSTNELQNVKTTHPQKNMQSWKKKI